MRHTRTQPVCQQMPLRQILLHYGLPPDKEKSSATEQDPPQSGATEHDPPQALHDSMAACRAEQAVHSGVTQTAGSVAGSTLEPRSATRLFSFDLRWPSGTLIKHIEIFDISVERFKQDMDEGLIEGIPRATTDIGGNWLESHNIVWGTQVLQDGQWLSDYDIPLGATLTVLRETQAKSE